MSEQLEGSAIVAVATNSPVSVADRRQPIVVGWARWSTPAPGFFNGRITTLTYDRNRDPDEAIPPLARRGAGRKWFALSVIVVIAALAWTKLGGPTTSKDERFPAASETSEPR